MIFSKSLLMQEAETYYTLTITSTDPVINQSTVTCQLSYDGISIYSTTATVKAGTIIAYTLTDTTHNNDGVNVVKTASVTMDSDITLTCNVTYSTSETSWSQPTLSSNGTLGGNSFAVSASEEYSTNYAYNCFDSNLTNYWSVSSVSDLPTTYILYNPVPIRVASITFQNQTSGYKSGSFAGSNTNGNYSDIVSSWTNSVVSNGATWTLSVNSSVFYKYHRIKFDTWGSGSYSPRLRNITIAASKQKYTYYWNIV